jgi:hypothetical protein
MMSEITIFTSAESNPTNGTQLFALFSDAKYMSVQTVGKLQYDVDMRELPTRYWQNMLAYDDQTEKFTFYFDKERLYWKRDILDFRTFSRETAREIWEDMQEIGFEVV